MSRVHARLPHPVEPPASAGVPTDPPSSPHADAARAEAAARFVVWDLVDEWGDQSFPASDPPANW
jgi:hypothetical protein